MAEIEIPSWLKGLPLAPVYRPTETEFADPIAYISKIEKQASDFGICKIIPPLSKPSKRYVFNNLNKSLAEARRIEGEAPLSVSSSDGLSRALFTTRQQELGCQNWKKSKGSAQLAGPKQVWQSGEFYTLEQFESKSRSFARQKMGNIKEANPVAVESLFWKTAQEKPIYIEYANDVPGSGFGEPQETFKYLSKRPRRKKYSARRMMGSYCTKKDVVISQDSRDCRVDDEEMAGDDAVALSDDCPNTSIVRVNEDLELKEQCAVSNIESERTAGWKLSNSPWNLQVIARSPGSLIRYMPEDVPGVTSPMVYVGMLFSWFAWHVEDHELHSMNFLHTGSPKTWYSVPGDSALLFEEVVRVHGYGGKLGAAAAFSLLGEKTTLLSPEVVVASGLRCCRLVQYPGEFVVTFPRAYHVGFSHGFNCGEAANFATTQWLKVAREAAVRRAAMNYLPMLSHQQLLCVLSISFLSRLPEIMQPRYRSSRLNDHKKERELEIKKAFVEDMLHESKLMDILVGMSTSYAVLWDPEHLPQSKNPQLLSSLNGASDVPKISFDSSDGESLMALGKVEPRCQSPSLDHHSAVPHKVNGETSSEYLENPTCSSISQNLSDAITVTCSEDASLSGLSLDSGALACVSCGILGFPCMAIVQPSYAAAKILFPEVDEVILKRSTSLEVPANSTPSAVSNAPSSNICDAFPMKKLGLPEDAFGNSNDTQADNLVTPGHQLTLSSGIALTSHCNSIMEPIVHDLDIGASRHCTPTDESLRPRILCLKHALKVQDLLKNKGGANLLLICHSDYPRIKAEALVVAQEINIEFNCQNVPLVVASKADLELIDYAVDNEGYVETGRNWTSVLSVNMQHCCKLNKQLTSATNEQPTLALDGLLYDRNDPCASKLFRDSPVTAKAHPISRLQWHVRKSRSLRSQHMDKGMHVNTDVAVLNASSEPAERPCLDLKERCVSGHMVLIDRTPECTANEGNVVVEPQDSSCGRKPFLQYSRRKRAGKRSEALKPCEFLRDLVNDDCQIKSTDQMEESKGSLHDDLQAVRTDNEDVSSACMAETKDGNEERENLEGTSCSISSGQEACLVLPAHLSPEDYESVQRIQNVDEAGNEERETMDCMSCRITNNQGTSVDSDTPATNKLSESSWSNKLEVCRDADKISFHKSLSTGFVEDGLDISGEYSKTVEMSDRSVDKGPSCCIGRKGDDSRLLLSSSASDAKVALLEQSALLPDINKTLDSFGVRRATYDEAHDTSSRQVDKALTVTTYVRRGYKRKREVMLFTRSVCEGLRPRLSKTVSSAGETNMSINKVLEVRKRSRLVVERRDTINCSHQCNIEGCKLRFKTEALLLLHKRNICVVQGCRKLFKSHKYLLRHQRVHVEDRPFKCSWQSCSMSFKWEWARTEHMRVHTGERPYICKVPGCGLTFRFVSDFSRHRRKTGHSNEHTFSASNQKRS